jgi:hypothetical protein
MGVTTLPFSFATVVSQLLDFSSAAAEDVPLWVLAAPVILVLGGGCGLFALLAVVQALVSGSTKLAYPRAAVLVMTIFGLMTLLALGAFGSRSTQYADSWLFFFWLPLLSSLHILFLGRNLLFGRSATRPGGPNARGK